MFYEGDLRGGIATAIEESKSVACFVSGDDVESILWKDDYLGDPDVVALLSRTSITLQLEAGSQGAKYLSEICPLPKTPAIVVIHNGQLREYMTTGTSKEDFLKRLKKVLSGDSNETSQNVPAPERIDLPHTSHEEVDGHEQAAATTGEPADQLRRSQIVEDLLTERRKLIEARRKKEEAAAKAERAAKVKTRQEELEKAQSGSSKGIDETNYAALQRKRQKEARDEKARILKSIEDDKEERRAWQLRRKEQENASQESPHLHRTVSQMSWNTGASDDSQCAIQIRLFDGSTIRSKFHSSCNLSKDIRTWIDQREIKIDIPYTIKHILSPQANRTFSVSDEEQSLLSLDLYPSATLVLVPINDFTRAYEHGTGTTSLVYKGISAGYGLLNSGVGFLSSSLASLVGGNATEQQAEGHLERTPPTSPSGTVRTLRDREVPEDRHQLYNGNALNFEPERMDAD